METIEVGGKRWNPAMRYVFRFVAIYFVLYVFPFPLDQIPGLSVVVQPWTDLWYWMVPAFGASVLGMEQPIAVGPNGSGDTTYDYVGALLVLLFALIGSAIWSLVDRKRKSYPNGARWLHVACRYYLGVVMLGYGFAKVFKTQFPFPSLERLESTYGSSSPMGLVWAFMGYSRSFNLFTGLGEVLGGLLLFHRRTATLGACLLVCILSNIVAINFGYDVPVKLYSVHLLLMAVGLLFPDLRRLANVLVWNRTAVPADLAPHFSRPMARWTVLAAKVLAIGWLLYSQISSGYGLERIYGDSRPRPPLYGIWEVEEFVADGEVVPPLLGDSSRWRSLVVDRPEYAALRKSDGSIARYGFAVDEGARTFTFSPFQDPEAKFAFTYDMEGPDELDVRGSFEGKELAIRMKRKPLEGFLLIERGFHWINEYPFHR